MKFFLVSLFVLTISCNTKVSNELPELTDSLITKIIKEKYTSNNNLDGAEFATVDSLIIKQKIINTIDKKYTIKFHINCSYQSASLAPDFRRQPPSLNIDTLIEISYINNEWKLSNK